MGYIVADDCCTTNRPRDGVAPMAAERWCMADDGILRRKFLVIFDVVNGPFTLLAQNFPIFLARASMCGNKGEGMLGNKLWHASSYNLYFVMA